MKENVPDYVGLQVVGSNETYYEIEEIGNEIVGQAVPAVGVTVYPPLISLTDENVT